MKQDLKAYLARSTRAVSQSELPQWVAGVTLCAATLLGSLHLVESATPGPMPVWEISVSAKVRCEDGAPRLPPSITLITTLPASSAQTGKGSRKARFTLSRGVSWGREGSLFLEQKGQLPRLLGQIDLQKIRCLQPLEAEAMGMNSGASFEVTLPLWMDPSRPVSLVRRPSFPCRRDGGNTHDSGWIRSAVAAEEEVERPDVGAPSGLSSDWTRASRDTLAFGKPSETIELSGVNQNRYHSWAACRLGETAQEPTQKAAGVQ